MSISLSTIQVPNLDLATRKVLIEKTETVVQKWKNSKLLEGLYGTLNPSIAQLLESQASQLLNDPSEYRRTYTVPVGGINNILAGQLLGISSRGFGKKSFFTKIKSFFIFLWRKIFKKKEEATVDFGNLAVPMIRRVTAQTVAFDLVSVQPMALPTGMLTYMDYVYNPEREDVYSRVVLVEKYKEPIRSRYSGSTTLSTLYNYYNNEELPQGR